MARPRRKTAKNPSPVPRARLVAVERPDPKRIPELLRWLLEKARAKRAAA